ncbi:MAG: dihydrodipicolinate synthase family protein [Acidobacteriota bacterium]
MDLSGVILPVPTPFSDGRVDLARFRDNLVRWLTWEGRPGHPGLGGEPFRIAGVLVAGSTGEAPFLTEDEVEALIVAARAVVPEDRILLAGAGRESTASTIEAVRRAGDAGASAVLVRPPNAFRPHLGETALVAHFDAVLAAAAVPMVLYSVPAHIGPGMPVGVVTSLAANPGVAGVKDSSPDTARIVEILAGDRPVKGDGFRVMAGNATVFYPALACGAAGGILAVACVVPGLACSLMAAWASNSQDLARHIQKRLTPIARAVTTRFGIAGLKAALDMIGLFGGEPRSPLQPLDEAARAELRAELDHALWSEDQELALGPRLGDPVEVS